MSSVLVVDDNEQSLYLLRTLLSGKGYDVATARNGAEALELTSKRVPDLIVSDILMPVMDGYTFCRSCKRDDRLRDIPFIFYTATYTDQKDEDLALGIGADRFIVKPAEPEDFLDAITQVLEERRKGRLQRRSSPTGPEEEFLREYNAILVHKLEEKLLELEKVHRAMIERDAINRAVLDSAPAAIAMVGPEGRIAVVNQAWSELASQPGDPGFLRLGIGDDLVARLELDRAGDDEVIDQLARGLSDVLARRRSLWSGELLHGSASDPLWFTVSITPVQQARSGAVIALFDTTRVKRAEEALQEAARRKDEFLALLGHELRNPLAPMATACSLLELLRHPDPRAERAREILARQVRHLSRIVDDLLDVSRIARGKLTIQRAPVDWTRMVRSTVEDHFSSFEARGIDFRFHLPADPLWVQGDSTRLTQILGLLLSNALKFTERGGRVSVRLSSDAQENWSTLVVRDTGIGMSASTIARLFRALEQEKQDSARTRGGVGLGLALVRGLVELQGGTVEARSEGVGKGSEFIVRFPLTEERSPAPQAGEPLDGKGLRILLVEDNRDAAESLGTVLEALGCEIQIAHDGPAGLELARKRPPAMLVCDIGLPGSMDGHAVARAFRGEPSLRRTRLVALTGYGQPEDRRLALEAGFDVHLTKPVDPRELLKLADGARARGG